MSEDRKRFEAHCREARAEGAAASIQFRIRTREGQERWIEHVCAPVAGPDGSDLGTRGSNRDVTDRRRSEEELRRALAEIERLKERLETDNSYLQEELWPERGIEGLVGTSNALRTWSRRSSRWRRPSTVLLQGETGTGKELVARAIHDRSPRRARPFVTVNCAALPPALVESELFGHEKGAFTGARRAAQGSLRARRRRHALPRRDRRAAARAAGEAAARAPGRRVRARRRHRARSRSTCASSPRPTATSTRRSTAGRFREDLFYRLNVVPITLPPLRERREDIPLLVTHFVAKHAAKLGKPALERLDGRRCKRCRATHWPGNVRELENVIERAVITSPGAQLQLSDSRGPSRTPSPRSPRSPAPPARARSWNASGS